MLFFGTSMKSDTESPIDEQMYCGDLDLARACPGYSGNAADTSEISCVRTGASNANDGIDSTLECDFPFFSSVDGSRIR